VEEAGEAMQRRDDEAMQRHRARSAAASNRPLEALTTEELHAVVGAGGEEVASAAGALSLKALDARSGE